MADANKISWRKGNFWTGLALALLGIFLLAGAAIAQEQMRFAGGFTIDYEDGRLDSSTGSGTINGVSVARNGKEIWRAASIFIDASGSPDGEDWFVNEARIVDFENPLTQFYVEAVEVKDLAIGRMLAGSSNGGEARMIGESSSFRLTNVTMVMGALVVEVESVTTSPFVLAALPGGGSVIADMSILTNGIVTHDKNQLSIDGPRDTRSWINMTTRLATRFEGEQMFVRFNYDAMIRELANVSLELDIAAAPTFYDELAPLLFDQSGRASPAGFIESGALAGGRFVMLDTGLINFIVRALAAQAGVSSQGVAGDLFRSAAQQNARSRLQKTFPSNAERLFPPVSAMLENGGTLTIELEPESPVPFINMFVYALGADRAIEELGISLSHQP